MASYFDISSAADLFLIHSSVRDHCELSQMAASVEDEIISQYRERNVGGYTEYPYYSSQTGTPYTTTDGKYIIWLDGYKVDADEADTRLKDAMRRTIADVISHRLKHYDDEPGIKSWTQGRRSVVYAGDGIDAHWPKSWNKRLIEFNLNPAFV